MALIGVRPPMLPLLNLTHDTGPLPSLSPRKSAKLGVVVIKSRTRGREKAAFPVFFIFSGDSPELVPFQADEIQPLNFWDPGIFR